MKEDKVYLQHIRESIRRIEENTEGGKDLFSSSHTLQDATLRNLQTMAESTQYWKNVSDKLREILSLEKGISCFAT